MAAGLLCAGSQAFVSHQLAVSSVALSVPISGSSVPYPGQLAVSGLDGVIDSMKVTLFVTHPQPDDLDIMLVGPSGQKVVLMSDAGGSGSLSAKEIRFVDGAPALPDGAAITSTEYRPTNYEGFEVYPAPAPSGTPAQTLSTFTGTNPNGTWRLFVVDDLSPNAGSVSWRISFTTRVTVSGGGFSIPNSGAASPYPGTISIPSFAGKISRVEATLTHISHNNPNDIDVLLVSPGGQKVRLMSDAGGIADISGVTLKFTDSAAGMLPNSTQIVSGSYKPSNYGLGNDGFPSPAPAEPYSDAMAAFNGKRAAGTWKLFVQDDSGGWSGVIASWSLTIVTTDAAPQIGVIPDGALGEGQTLDLAVSASDSDGDPIAFSSHGLPAFATLTDNGNKTATIHLAPQAGDAGVYSNVEVAASDGDLSDSEAFDITVADKTKPTTTATRSPAANGAGWNNSDVTVALSATDLSSAVQSITYSAVGAQSIPLTTVAGSSTSTPPITAEGTTTLTFHATDASGNIESDKGLVIKLDKTKPVLVQPLKIKFTLDAQLGSSGQLPITLFNWLANETGSVQSGLDHYVLERSQNGGAFQALALSGPLVTTDSRLQSPGVTAQYRVRALDVAGNSSDPSSTPPEGVALHQESDGAIVDTGTWTTEAAPFASGGSTQFASAAGAKVTYSFFGSHVTWVSARGPDRGIAEVRVDGNLAATVDLFAASLQGKTTVFAKNNMADQQHTIEILVLGTKNAASTGTRVDLDAFGVLNPV